MDVNTCLKYTEHLKVKTIVNKLIFRVITSLYNSKNIQFKNYFCQGARVTFMTHISHSDHVAYFLKGVANHFNYVHVDVSVDNKII